MPKRTRTPRTLSESKFSVQERQRVRYALASYRLRRGQSYERLLAEIEKINNYESGFKDKQQIKEFLSGSEPSDDKLLSVIKYLSHVEPDLCSGIYDDRFDVLAADVLAQLFLSKANLDAISTSSPYDLMLSGIYEYRHIYGEGSQYRFPLLEMSLLRITHVPNASHYEASLLIVDWRSHPKAASVSDQFLAQYTPHNHYEVMVDAGIPTYIGVGQAYSDFAKILLDDTKLGKQCINPYYLGAKGFLFPRGGSHFFMFQRTIFNRAPIFYTGCRTGADSVMIAPLDFDLESDRLSGDGGLRQSFGSRSTEYKRLDSETERIMEAFLAQRLKDVQ